VVEIELPDLRAPRLLQGGQARPAGEELASARSAQLAGPFQSLREGRLEPGGETVGQPGAVVDQLATLLRKHLDLARAGIVRLPGPQAVGMATHQLQQQIGVLGIALGSAAEEGLAVVGRGLGRYRIQDQEVVSHQGVDQRAARLLDGDGHPAEGETGAQLAHPALQGFGTLGQNERLHLRRADRLQASLMLLIGPVQADPGDNVRNRGRHVFGLLSKDGRTRLLESAIALIVESSERQHLSIRC